MAKISGRAKIPASCLQSRGKEEGQVEALLSHSRGQTQKPLQTFSWPHVLKFLPIPNSILLRVKSLTIDIREAYNIQSIVVVLVYHIRAPYKRVKASNVLLLNIKEIL